MKYIIVTSKGHYKYPTTRTYAEEFPKPETVPSPPKEECYRIFRKVDALLENAPETWDMYKDVRNGLIETISMEYAELMTACVTGTYHDKLRELVHLASAVTCAYEKMTCPDSPTE